MTSLSKKVDKTYSILKSHVTYYYNKGNFNECLRTIITTSHIAYLFNLSYTDHFLENTISNIAKKLQTDHFIAEDENVLIYDSFCYSDRGLINQYIKAISAWDVRIKYIIGNDRGTETKQLISFLRQYSNIEIIRLKNQEKPIAQINFLKKVLLEFKPSKSFLYLTPWDAIAVTTFANYPNIKKYLINLTDHAFWLGSSIIDFSIEFRSYGYTISHEKRGIDKKKLILQPFYPFQKEQKFQGLPDQVENKKIIFSGGAYYKIYGEDFLFFKIIKNILELHSDVVILYAGWGDDKPILNFINENSYQSRFILLGVRSDFCEIIKRSTVYLNTIPLGGGLMTQYAAANGVPILSYSLNGNIEDYIEPLIFQKTSPPIKLTHRSLDEFYIEVNKLFDNEKYRLEVGQLLKSSLLTPIQFNISLHENIYDQKEMEVEDVPIDYERIRSYLIRNNSNEFVGYLLKQFRTLFPIYFLFLSKEASKFIFMYFRKYMMKKIGQNLKFYLYK